VFPNSLTDVILTALQTCRGLTSEGQTFLGHYEEDTCIFTKVSLVKIGSKFGKNKNMAHQVIADCVIDALTTF